MQVLDDAAPRGKGEAQLSLPRDQEGGSFGLGAGAATLHWRCGELSGHWRGIENVNGSVYSDTLRGDSGRNMLQGLNGDDVITGGDGIDTSIYQGGRGDYVISLPPGVQVAGVPPMRSVRDSALDRDGNDIVSGIERLLFSDGIWFV